MACYVFFPCASFSLGSGFPKHGNYISSFLAFWYLDIWAFWMLGYEDFFSDTRTSFHFSGIPGLASNQGPRFVPRHSARIVAPPKQRRYEDFFWDGRTSSRVRDSLLGYENFVFFFFFFSGARTSSRVTRMPRRQSWHSRCPRRSSCHSAILPFRRRGIPQSFHSAILTFELCQLIFKIIAFCSFFMFAFFMSAILFKGLRPTRRP